MQLFNSLTRRAEELRPLEPGNVMMYVCGLTPYDSAHIGHARTYVSFDSLKRYLMKKGLSVFHIQNITDVDDKIIRRCRETGADPAALTRKNHDEALELFSKLNILPADVYPAVTGHIPQIIGLIQVLIGKGKAYETEGGVYFSISSFREYGTLSGQNLEQIRAGARIEVDERKRDPADFALWKRTDGEIIEFDSPWGRGRPGWHIECSAMAREYAKRTLDIHGGARDLIFPHHENEIAQSEGTGDGKFCNLWMHTGFLTVEGEKMAKSLGNFITLREALARSSPNALRLFYLQAHYRSPLDYDADALESMEESVERIFNSIGLIREECAGDGDGHPDPEFRSRSGELASSFYSHLEDDFRTPEAIASLFSLLRLANSHLESRREKPDRAKMREILAELESMLWILGIAESKAGLGGKEEALYALVTELGGERPQSPEGAIEILMKMRDNARAKKDFRASDQIRARLKEMGIILEDRGGASGARWKLA
ncbi:MAG: cysteine--tRNA ligase [Candidatus Micrarchaeota archaeon]